MRSLGANSGGNTTDTGTLEVAVETTGVRDEGRGDKSGRMTEDVIGDRGADETGDRGMGKGGDGRELRGVDMEVGRGRI
jgi:hypothetical protein